MERKIVTLMLILVFVGTTATPVMGEWSLPGGYWLKYLSTEEWEVFNLTAMFETIDSLDEKTKNGIPLTPGITGKGYIFYGTGYDDGWVDIVSPGVYHLTDDLHVFTSDYGIRISAPHDILLNGNTYGIINERANRSGTVGIDITKNATGATVLGFGRSDVGITGFEDGILSKASPVIISRMQLSRNDVGINSYGISSIITGNTIRKNGIGLNLSSHVGLIFGNTLNENTDGILTNGSTYIIARNHVENSGKGIETTGSSILIADNSLVGDKNGIISSGSSIDYQANLIEYTEYGINATGSSINIAGNSISMSENGIFSSGSSANIVENVLNMNKAGIISRGASTNIQMNNLSSNDIGIISTGHYTAIMNNLAHQNGIAIQATNYSVDTLQNWNYISESRDIDVAIIGDVKPEDESLSFLSSLVISDISMPDGALPGENTTLNISFTDKSDPPLSEGTKITLSPGSTIAKNMGLIEGTLKNGTVQMNPVITIPAQNGTYEYSFIPERVKIKSGNPLLVHAGPFILFTITVGDDVTLNLVR